MLADKTFGDIENAIFSSKSITHIIIITYAYMFSSQKTCNFSEVPIQNIIYCNLGPRLGDIISQCKRADVYLLYCLGIVFMLRSKDRIRSMSGKYVLTTRCDNKLRFDQTPKYVFISRFDHF